MELRAGHKDFLVMAKEILEGGNRMRFRASGWSMSPFIRDGDIIILEPLNRLSVGDVILFEAQDGRVLLHRVSRKKTNGVLTWGDAASFGDGLVPQKRILGRVLEIPGSYNFHLKNPFKFFIGRRILYSEKLFRFPFVVRIGKVAAAVLG